MLVEAGKNNTIALKLYEKMGFKVVGEKKNFYEDGLDAIIMIWNF